MPVPSPNADLAASRNLRGAVFRELHPTTRTTTARAVRWGLNAVIVAGIVGVILSTTPDQHRLGIALIKLALVVFGVEYLIRLWSVPEHANAEPGRPWQTRRRWAVSLAGLVDALAVIAVPAAWAAGIDGADSALFGILWVFKFARYSPGLVVLARVIQIEAEPLLSVLLAFVVVMLCAAVLGYLFERDSQPLNFGSIPMALWWTITTLTTTGYGDEIPQTALGRLLAGGVMVCGIMVFALWAGILASGYAQEMRRREFLKTWDLVAKVPFFRDIGAALIAEVARRLKTREVTTGTAVLRRGQPGDCMYFIVSGEIEIQIQPRPLQLSDGDFFGEIALITGGPRTASAVATRPTTLLLLDIADFRDLAARHPELTRAIHHEADRRLARPPSPAEAKGARGKAEGQNERGDLPLAPAPRDAKSRTASPRTQTDV